nr:MAG TPA: hypothetical protein [Bacteriophage sp.]
MLSHEIRLYLHPVARGLPFQAHLRSTPING